MSVIDVFIIVGSRRIPIAEFISGYTTISLDDLNFNLLKNYIDLYVEENFNFLCKGDYFVTLMDDFKQMSETVESDIDLVGRSKSNMENIFYKNIINSILFRLAIRVIKHYKNMIDRNITKNQDYDRIIQNLSRLTTIQNSIHMNGYEHDTLEQQSGVQVDAYDQGFITPPRIRTSVRSSMRPSRSDTMRPDWNSSIHINDPIDARSQHSRVIDTSLRKERARARGSGLFDSKYLKYKNKYLNLKNKVKELN